MNSSISQVFCNTCLQRLKCKSLGERFETGCTLGLDEDMCAGSSTVCLHAITNIFFSLLEWLWFIVVVV